jgi:hypothetical protein
MKHLKLYEEYSEEELNRILDKISQKGSDSINADEYGYLSNYGSDKSDDYRLEDETSGNKLSYDLQKEFDNTSIKDKIRVQIFSIIPKGNNAVIHAVLTNNDELMRVNVTVTFDGSVYKIFGKLTSATNTLRSEEPTNDDGFTVKQYNISNPKSKELNKSAYTAKEVIEILLNP